MLVFMPKTLSLVILEVTRSLTLRRPMPGGAAADTVQIRVLRTGATRWSVTSQSTIGGVGQNLELVERNVTRNSALQRFAELKSEYTELGFDLNPASPELVPEPDSKENKRRAAAEQRLLKRRLKALSMPGKSVLGF